MPAVDFKAIQPVPTYNDFLDIVLSKTQRKTPTVIHKGYSITRIRSFYLRKIRFTHASFEERLGAIVNQFPRLDDIHPFYRDLMNVLYDKDHYKLALSQISTAKHLIGNVAAEYQRLLKYGDSLYQCKQLKRAALGRMATIMRRQKDALIYLEEVRQHVTRLPSIDPHARTLLICGFPNVGKSSFMNKVTRAGVEVQPYAFTTKSLFVGHMDYKYLRWQVIDTPGILDHPLEDRNTIEMQSITALAHLRACILYFMDVSEQCGYKLEEQIALFNSLKPLFVNKPVLIVANKADLMTLDQLSSEQKVLLEAMCNTTEGRATSVPLSIMSASCVTEQGVIEVRNVACEMLLAQRVEQKLSACEQGSNALNKTREQLMGKLTITQPQTRDTITRSPCIPEAVLLKRAQIMGDVANVSNKKLLAKDMEAMNGGAGVYSFDLHGHYQLANPAWVRDIQPEILDGKNIADFIDPDIEAHLARLEAEEETLLVAKGELKETKIAMGELSKPDLPKARLMHKRSLARQVHHATMSRNGPHIVAQRIIQRKKTSGKFSTTPITNMDIDHGEEKSGNTKNALAVKRAMKLKNLSQKKFNVMGKKGEADRNIRESKPKHLFSGKRKSGTHDRR